MTTTPPEARPDRTSEIIQAAQDRVDRLRTMYPTPHTPILRETEAWLNGALAVRDALAAECERMRPVVEAALKLEIRTYAIYAGVADYEPKPEDYQQYVALEGAGDFRAAVAAYLATGPAAGAQE